MSFWQPTENKQNRKLRLLNWRRDGLTNKQRHLKQREARKAAPNTTKLKEDK